jgi:hypothetical protein
VIDGWLRPMMGVNVAILLVANVMQCSPTRRFVLPSKPETPGQRREPQQSAMIGDGTGRLDRDDWTSSTTRESKRDWNADRDKGAPFNFEIVWLSGEYAGGHESIQWRLCRSRHQWIF